MKWFFSNTLKRRIERAQLAELDRFKLRIELRSVHTHAWVGFFQFCIGLSAVGGIWITWNQYRKQQEIDARNRIQQVYSQLGAPLMRQRLSGVFDLQRLLDERLIGENELGMARNELVGLIRAGACGTARPLVREKGDVGSSPPEDVQAALAVLSNVRFDPRTEKGIDLTDCELSGANLSGAFLQKAQITWTKLVRAVLDGAQLADASLDESDLRGASFKDARFKGSVSMKGTHIEGVDLSVVRMTESFALTTEMLEGSCFDSRTRTPNGVALPRSKCAFRPESNEVIPITRQPRSRVDRK